MSKKVPIENIKVGDKVELTRTVDDMDITTIGTVDRIIDYGLEREFYTEAGQALGSYAIGGKRSAENTYTAKMIKAAPELNDVFAGLEEV